MMEIRWSINAVNVLSEIFDYIAKDNIEAAENIVEEIRKKVGNLSKFPKSGKIIPELNSPDKREVLVYSYRIMYKIKKNHIEIHTIRHGARKFPS